MMSPKSKVQSPKSRLVTGRADCPQPAAQEQRLAGIALQARSGGLRTIRPTIYEMASKKLSAFTLIELMIVVAIMGVMMLISVPIVYRVWHKEAMRQAISDVTEICNKARAQAILQDKMVDVVFHPRDLRLEISGGGGGKKDETTINPQFSTATVSGSSGSGTTLPERIRIELLDINMAGVAYENEEIAVVHFYPDGTCDELRMVLLDTDDSERRGIELETATSMVNMVPDIREWRNR